MVLVLEDTEVEKLSILIHHVNREMFEILEKWEVPTFSILKQLNGKSVQLKTDIELYLFLERIVNNLKTDTLTLTNESFAMSSAS